MGITEVQAALEIYFDVMYDCDMEKFDRIFHPTCTLFTGQDGALTVRPFQQYRQEMASRTAPRTAGQSREAERIVKIDMLADDLALAQVRLQIHEKLFADNLNLVKVNGHWMIVAKIYHLMGKHPGP
jgi:hypothetical protein